MWSDWMRSVFLMKLTLSEFEFEFDTGKFIWAAGGTAWPFLDNFLLLLLDSSCLLSEGVQHLLV